MSDARSTVGDNRGEEGSRVSTLASGVQGGYPAKQCTRAVHSDNSPAPPIPKVDQATHRRAAHGNGSSDALRYTNTFVSDLRGRG